MREFYEGRRVLITGGIGFIGSNLAIRLVELGARVVLVDSMLPAYGAELANIEPIRHKVRVNFSDVRDQYSLGQIVKGEELIFSLAGQISHSDSMRDPMTDLEINCRSQLSLLERCRHDNPEAKIVFASTRQLYGRPQYLPVDEEHPRNPVDVNGINKLAAEMYYTLYHQVYGMRTVSLRLTNTYGPRMELGSNKKGFAGIFIRKALAGEEIKLFGDCEQKLDFNHVDDVVDALLAAGVTDKLDGEVYNLGHHQPHSLREFCELLAEHCDFPLRFVPFPPEAKRIDIGDYYGDYGRFASAVGWKPQIDLADGLARTIDFYRA